MTALYAWVMSQTPRSQTTPEANMVGGLNLRPALSVWNALFHHDRQDRYDSSQSAAWNRGEYLVNGVAHCGACHTPRHAGGAEQKGRAYLQGAWVHGWHAPSLTSSNASPMPWREVDFFNYLRKGHTGFHGTAGGPMAEVVRNLKTATDDDLHAMAVYLASLQTDTVSLDESAFLNRATQTVAQAAAQAPLPDAAARQFEGSCGSCHHDGDGPQLLGVNQPLALNSQLHSDNPANLVRVIREGIQRPASPDLGFMPAFEHSLSHAQITALVQWMRRRFAPDKPPWNPEDIARALE